MNYKQLAVNLTHLGQQFNAISAQRQALVDGGKEAALQAREERKELQKLRTQEQRVKGRIELLANGKNNMKAI